MVAAALGVLGAVVIAVLSAAFTRGLERQRQRSSLESQAVVDIGRAIAMTALGAEITRADARVLFADARLRLAAYGGEKAAEAFAHFLDARASTDTAEGRAALVAMVKAVRRRRIAGRTQLDDATIEQLLFGVSAPALGGIETWNVQVARIRSELPVAPPHSGAGGRGLASEAEARSAIDASFARIEQGLRALLATSVVGNTLESLGAEDLARLALERGLIDAGIAHSIGGLAVLRDLARFAAPGTGLDPHKADEFDAMARAVLYALEQR